jgi:hypothetical protein
MIFPRFDRPFIDQLGRFIRSVYAVALHRSPSSFSKSSAISSANALTFAASFSVSRRFFALHHSRWYSRIHSGQVHRSPIVHACSFRQVLQVEQ